VPTAAPSYIGSIAASLEAAEVDKVLAGQLDLATVGMESRLDVLHQCHFLTQLVRNPGCRFPHESPWTIQMAPNLSLREILTLGGAPIPGGTLSVPGQAFLTQRVCAGCGHREPVWRLRIDADAPALGCSRCGACCPERGFDLVEQLVSGVVPPEILDRRLDELGLRYGDVFCVGGRSRGAAHFELSTSPRPGGRSTPAVFVAGLGNIGSYLVHLLARLPRVRRLAICDPDHYEAANLNGQNIGPEDVGRAKARVQADALRKLRPDLEVEVFAVPLEDVPLGALRGSVVVGCLDSRLARLRLAERAWHMASPFIDAAVDAASGQVRVNTYVPDPGGPCFECSFEAASYEALEQPYPCAGSPAPREDS
jgi:hypothetical protein